MVKHALAVIDQQREEGEPDLLRLAGGLIGCAERSPRNALVILEAASVLLDAAKEELAGAAQAEQQKPARAMPPPARRQTKPAEPEPPVRPGLKAFNRDAIARAKAAPTPTPTPAPAPAARTETREPSVPAGESAVAMDGVVVSLIAEDEQISFRDHATDLTERQAKLAALLLRASPYPVDRAFLCRKMEIGGTLADTQLGSIIGDLRRALETIGLEVKTVKGVGVSLAIPGQAAV